MDAQRRLLLTCPLTAAVSRPSPSICGDVICCRIMCEAISAKLVLSKRGPDLPPRRILFVGS
ncbi:hypothetical protein FYJ43_10380 [Cutibacterium sp. WCA-380-WT-3A]|uniref:Uncharacterized protein n=1 Tax=Cutibacterium porci TaxID=2605781 RepID=A0A7K0J8X6_9ACTN|nr:hypothetical protein [Cutibacterium porci]